MASSFDPWKKIFSLLFLSLHLHLSFSQSNSPQNIETFFPSNLSPPLPSPPLTSKSSSSSTGKTIAKSVGITAAVTIVIAGVFFFFLQRFVLAKNKKKNEETNLGFKGEVIAPIEDDKKHFNGTLKGLIVDENGLDVLYWRNLEGGQLRSSFKKEVLLKINELENETSFNHGRSRRIKSKPVQEFPLLHDVSSNSSSFDRIRLDSEDSNDQIVSHGQSEIREVSALGRLVSPNQPPRPPLAQPPPPPPPSPLRPVPSPPQIAPIAVKKNPSPPPPPPPKSMMKPPPPPPRKNTPAEASSSEGSSSESGKAKLKPLHWDKVNANADHSMVWDKIGGGSFRVDDNLMEALFGSVATNRKPTETNQKSNMGNLNSTSPAQIFILDPRKSQNIAIVLRSLNISRQEILDSLLEGRGLDSDTLEKISKLSPTKEEETLILSFDGNPTKLANAESFLFHLFKAIPSPFTRIESMLFRSNYEPETTQLKNSLQILELGCKELRTRGLFLKLLEAILKAGNRMNAGTSRGNAQAFNLTALRKLSDVKSSDGKTTLLHFVVEEVVRFEGKRCLLNKNNSFGRSNSRTSTSKESISDSPLSKQDKEQEYMQLGLPIIGGLSAEFSNVKKAATIDYEALMNSSTSLTIRVTGIRSFVTQVDVEEGPNGFVREMKKFLVVAETELKFMKEEQIRIMDLVKRTTQYYDGGVSKDKSDQPLQLFAIVKDFLGMVDQVCIDIARSSQKKKSESSISGTTSPPSTAKRAMKFPFLPPNFLSDKSKALNSSSNSSEDDEF